MTAHERVKRTIEFAGPDRIAIAGNCMEYDTHGDVIYHFPKMDGVAWWIGGGGVDEWGCRWESNRENDMGQVVGHPLRSMADLGTLPRPHGLDPQRYADLERELSDRPDAYHVFCNGPALFERMHFLRGFDRLLLDMAEAPTASAHSPTGRSSTRSRRCVFSRGLSPAKSTPCAAPTTLARRPPRSCRPRHPAHCSSPTTRASPRSVMRTTCR